METKVDTLCFLAQPEKENNQFKDTKQPELPENRTVRKSNNQEVKEEMFIQTGMRSRDRQPGQRGRVARQ